MMCAYCSRTPPVFVMRFGQLTMNGSEVPPR